MRVFVDTNFIEPLRSRSRSTDLERDLKFEARYTAINNNKSSKDSMEMLKT